MTELDLMKVIGYAQDVHILDADEMPVKRKIIPFSKSMIRAIAALLAVVLATGLFLQTPMGAAAVETVKTQISRFLEILFPPRDRVEYIEGIPQTVHVEAQGREPEENSPGFSIYVNPDSYTMTEENGSWFIRPIRSERTREEIRQEEQAILQDLTPEEQEAHIDKRLEELERYYASLPPVEMEIREIPDKSALEAAQEIRAEMKKSWETVTDISGYDREPDLSFDALDGTGTYSRWETHHFRNNTRGGCFHIVMRGYQEAYNHGTRFYYMLESFTLVAPQDTSQYGSEPEALLNAMKQEVAFAQEQEEKLGDAVSQGDMNTEAFERSVLWIDVHEKLWTALEQTMSEEFMADLTAEHLDWCAGKRIEMDQILEELGYGSLAASASYGKNAKATKERALVLLQYLEGTAVPAQREQNVEPSPRPMVDAFVKAYFGGDEQTIRQYLSDTYSGPVEIYSSGTEIIHAVKGLDEIPQTMARQGSLTASVEFRQTPDSDSFTYLTISLVWEDSHWAVSSFGLEG